MEIVKKWLFRISTGEVANLDISHDEDGDTEVDKFINDIIKEIQENRSTKQYKTRSTSNKVMKRIKKLNDVELTDEKYMENANDQLFEVAERLVEIEKDVNSQSGHLNKIQQGELLLVLLRDEEEQTDKFLLSKVEVVTMLNTDDVSITRGIIKEIKRLWKSCLFTLKEIPEENSSSYYIADVYSSTSSTYWHHRFLELDEMSSDESNTRNSFIAIDKLLNKEVKKYFPKDHQILRNTVVQYYRKGGDLDYDDMIEAIFESYSPIQESFTDDIKNDLVKKLRELPTKKSGGFDTHFKAITSVLKVAIKEKIEKFFEVKKETAEFIANTLHELSQIKILIVEKMVYNICAIGIFLSTTLIPTILETKNLDSIFTSDVRIIIKISMFGSILYCVLTNFKNYFLYENYKRTLDKLKKNFEEYYSNNELNQIFGVQELNEIRIDILKISIPVSLLWIVMSIIGIIKFW
ncbi:TPA: hypothetical protein ACT2IM_001670 [Streptococcus suis]